MEGWVMSKKQLYVSDLDGTLLNEKGELSLQSYEILKNLLEQGLLFTVASARPIVAIKRILKDLPISLPVISANGAYLSDFKSLGHLQVNAMSSVSTDELIKVSKYLNVNPFVCTWSLQGDRTYWSRFDNEGQKRFVEERIANKDPRLAYTENIEQETANPVVMFMLLDERSKLEFFVKQLSDEVRCSIDVHINEDVYGTQCSWLVITDAKATKHEAIKFIRSQQGLEDCELIVFGDQTNDLSMMSIAEKRIAVENAVDAVRGAANEVIGRNTEDSVARYILKSFKK